MFGRATIRLGIGPHSSCKFTAEYGALKLQELTVQEWTIMEEQTVNLNCKNTANCVES